MDAHKVGGEVRRINVVYFLSRGGRTDHPHLFRVNHLNLNRAGVRLRGMFRSFVDQCVAAHYYSC